MVLLLGGCGPRFKEGDKVQTTMSSSGSKVTVTGVIAGTLLYEELPNGETYHFYYVDMGELTAGKKKEDLPLIREDFLKRSKR